MAVQVSYPPCACREINLLQEHRVHQHPTLLGAQRLEYTEITKPDLSPEIKLAGEQFLILNYYS